MPQAALHVILNFQVYEQEIDGFITLDKRQCLFNSGCRQRLVALRLKKRLREDAYLLFVLYKQDNSHRRLMWWWLKHSTTTYTTRQL
jgi:hypothetical protein